MKKPWRIDKSLLDETLRTEIENKLSADSTIDWNKIVNRPQITEGNQWRSPVATFADLPMTENVLGDLRLVLDTSEVYTWKDGWELIGANDTNVGWEAISNKPNEYPPTAHTHTEAEITDLTKDWTDITSKPTTFPPSSHNHNDLYYSKSETDTKLSSKVDVVVGKGLSTNDYSDNDKLKLESLSDSASVDYATMNQNLTNHENNATVHVTQADHDSIATIAGKADKTYTDTQLAGKVATSTFNGHVGNATIHVTQTDKDTWNGKSNFSGSYADLTNKPTIPTNLTDTILTLGIFTLSYNASTNSLDIVSG